jgi:hypothetical protein
MDADHRTISAAAGDVEGVQSGECDVAVASRFIEGGEMRREAV